MKNKSIIIGVAGHIASGKSEVCRYLAHLGAGYIEADEVVSDLYRKDGDGYRKIASYFGSEYLKKNGEINRRKLAKFVFSDSRKIKILNSLIHPLVNREIGRMLSAKKQKLIVIEAAYFEKKGLMGLVDGIIWVDCERAKLKKRAIANNNISAEMFEQIMEAQHKPEKIDFIVKNNGNLSDLHALVDKIYPALLSLTGV